MDSTEKWPKDQRMDTMKIAENETLDWSYRDRVDKMTAADRVGKTESRGQHDMIIAGTSVGKTHVWAADVPKRAAEEVWARPALKVRPEPKPDPKVKVKVKVKARNRRYGPVPVITARREEVLDLVVLGWSNREIGRSLGLSELTVKNHVSAVLKLLGARNRVAAAVAWALRRQAEGKA